EKTEAAFMRYRRLSYRYALVLTTGQDWSVDAPRLAESAGVRFAQTYWRPEADICESDSTIVVTVDLAGIDQDALDVVLYEDALIVEGQRRLSTAPNGVYHRAEIRQGPFRLELALPAAFDLDRVDARYDQGLLRITFPKRQRDPATIAR
ncbi:MAG: Hsp20/alpha crystallin family protein, partial [Thermomicrobiales bacterium]